jgi:hypothetical protein
MKKICLTLATIVALLLPASALAAGPSVNVTIASTCSGWTATLHYTDITNQPIEGVTYVWDGSFFENVGTPWGLNGENEATVSGTGSAVIGHGSDIDPVSVDYQLDIPQIIASGPPLETSQVYPADLWTGRLTLFAKIPAGWQFCVRSGSVLGVSGFVVLTPGTYSGSFIKGNDSAWLHS